MIALWLAMAFAQDPSAPEARPEAPPGAPPEAPPKAPPKAPPEAPREAPPEKPQRPIELPPPIEFQVDEERLWTGEPIPVPTYEPDLSLVRGGLRTHRYSVSRNEGLYLIAGAFGAAVPHTVFPVLTGNLDGTALSPSPGWVRVGALASIPIALLPVEASTGSNDIKRRIGARYVGRVAIQAEASMLSNMIIGVLEFSDEAAAGCRDAPLDSRGVECLVGTRWSATPAYIALFTSATTGWSVTLMESRRTRGMAWNDPLSYVAVGVPTAAGYVATHFATQEWRNTCGDEPNRDAAADDMCGAGGAGLTVWLAPAVGALTGLIVPVMH